jgi:choice-of-anchor B domain-containing protein
VRQSPRCPAVAVLALLFGIACGHESSGPVTAIGPASPDHSPPSATLNMQLLGRLDLPTLTAAASAASLPPEDAPPVDHSRHDAQVATRGAGNWGYTAPDGRRFALTGTSAGLSVDDVSQPTRPRHIALISGPDSGWREVKTYRDIAYVTTEASHGLDIVDLRAPDRPAKLGTYSDTFTSAHTLCIDEARGILFANGTRLNGRDSGMRVLSLADPAHPREVGSFGAFYTHDCVVRGTTLYASAIYDGFLAVLDVADPANVRERTRFNTGRRFTHNSWPTVDGRFLFTTDEREDAPLEGWNITDPFRPLKVSEYLGKPGTVPHNVVVDGNRLLVAHYTDGVHLLDIADPTRPRLIGRYDTFTKEVAGDVFDGVWGAYIFPGTNLIVASDMSNGLFVLQYTGP